VSLAEALTNIGRPLADIPPTLRIPRVTYNEGKPAEITTGDVAKATTQDEYRDRIRQSCEVDIPEGYELQLVEAWHNTSAWTRATADQELAVTAPTWRYRFKVVPQAVAFQRTAITELAKYVKTRRSRPAKTITGHAHAEIVCLADLQIGKVDERGGTPELEARFYGAMAEVIARLKKSKPALIVLAELGDGCENFMNTSDQAYSNDRNLIAQLDLHATFLTYAATELAKLAPKLIIVGVPSNHMEAQRVGGKPVGGPENDYGLLTLSQLKRAFSLNPKAFGHVEFAWPGPFEVSIVLNVAGHNVMFTHGHYTRGAGAADSVPKWLERQFAAEYDYHAARMVITGHYHHLRIQQIIGGRWWLQCPALDNGSSWLKRINGQGDSDAGILVVRVDPAGWSQQEILGNAA
jgi:hypothetical protein